MGRMVINPATLKMPLFLILSLWQRQGRPGRYENGLAAFQRLYSPFIHAKVI